MKKNVIALIAGAMVLCMAAAGCASQGNDNTGNTNETAETAATEEAAAQATQEPALEEDDMSWQEEDDAYLTGINAADYVELPEDYKHLTVEAARPVDPTDDEVEARIDTELQNRATMEEVDRKVKKGDTVNIDFVGKMDGEAFDGGSGNYDLEIGSGRFIDGFEDGLIGAKKGETLDIELTFPEDYYETSLAGRDVVFTVTVNTISKTVVPELTDDFVKSLNLTNAFGQAVTTVDDYEDYIRSNMIEEREATYETTVKSAIVDALLDTCTFTQDPPENLVEKYNYLLTRQLTYYALQNYMDLETYMVGDGSSGITKDNYRDVIYDMAKRWYAKQGLAFQAIADKKELNPDEDEISTVIAEYVASDASTEKVEDLSRVIRESLRDEIMTDKVIDYLYEHCRVKDPAEEDDADAAATSAAAAEADTSEEEAETGETAEAAEEEKEEKDDKDKDDKDKDDKDKDDKDKDDKDKEDKDK